MTDDQRRSLEAGLQGRAHPLFDKDFDTNYYRQGQARRALETPWIKPNRASAVKAYAAGHPGEYAKAFGVIALIVVVLGVMKWGRGMDEKKKEDELYSRINPVPVHVANRFAQLLAEPGIGAAWADCVGKCPVKILGTATSVTQQGAVPGWVRLIAHYPQGYIIGWAAVDTIEARPFRPPARIPPRISEPVNGPQVRHPLPPETSPSQTPEPVNGER